MSERPEDVSDDQVLLLRRAAGRAYDRRTGFAKPSAFRLRTAKAELSLSFFDANMATPQQVLIGAPSNTWGVLAVSAGTLRELGSRVVRERVPGMHVGEAHVSATPPAYEDAQIPLELQLRLAVLCEWILIPTP